jgi:hypothetical protein
MSLLLNILIVLVAGIMTDATAQIADSLAVYLFPDENPVTGLAVWKQNRGDSSMWRDPAYDDSRWDIRNAGTLWTHDAGVGKGIKWYRLTIFIPEPLDSLRPLALYQRSIICANEVYWDGALLTQNGRIADAGSLRGEVPGKSAQFTIVPQNLSRPGRHVAAIRVSNVHTYSGLMEAPLQIGYLPDILARLHVTETLLLLCAGIFLITAIFSIAVLWGRTKGFAYGVFSILCLSSAVFLLIDTAVHYFPFSLNHYYTIALLNDIPWYCMIVLLPVFFLYEFSLPGRALLSAIIAVIALFVIVPSRLIMFGILPVSWLDTFLAMNQMNMYGVALFAAICSALALFRHESGGLPALTGCAALLAGDFISFQMQVEYAWALGFCILIILLTISLAHQMAIQNRKRQENELKSARLELELLKKHIQPHFLLNSLNSIIAWLEENPATAARLVNALAQELRAILDFSKEKLITINEELRLCRLHCEVMGLRQDKQYTLIADAIPDTDKIPPLVFHTMVENGLTHGCAGEFVVKRMDVPGSVQYSIFNTSAKPQAPAAGVVRDGTGIRYVKTRLQEAFPGAWDLSYGPRGNGWEVIMKIPLSGKK